MSIDSRVLELIGGLADPAQRASAASAIGLLLGCDTLVFFAPDPELGIMLPAPGFRQTLPHASEWRLFVGQCVERGEYNGELRDAAGEMVRAHGCAGVGGVVAVGTGAQCASAGLVRLRPLMTLLSALFRDERRVATAEVQLSTASESMARAGALASSLQAMRLRLESALREAEQARREATDRATEADVLAEELRVQATELELQTELLEELNAQLEEQTVEAMRAKALADSANRSKSDFLANMSHELRTPLNAILGYTELLAMEVGGSLSQEQHSHLERIRASSRHLLTLINDVLDLAKIEAGKMLVQRVPERIGSAIEDAVNLLSLEAAQQGVAVENMCTDLDVIYIGDEDRVRQIITNFLSNAIKFTPSGGRVEIRCGAATPPDDTGLASGPWAFISVQDSGIGMTDDELKRVFRPFVQAETGRSRSHGGTGLGLTISRQLARLMGGEVSVRSKPGEGSLFTLWLPQTEGAPGSLDKRLLVRTAQV